MKSVAEHSFVPDEQVTEPVLHVAVQSAAKTVTGLESSQKVDMITVTAATSKVARAVFFMV